VKAQLLTGGIDETLLRIEGTSRHSVLADGNTQQYTGRENDNPGNAGGLYYYRARYYMPGCARFISEDPIGWASGQTNNYAYVGGNPVSFTDPTGLCAGDDYAWQAASGQTSIPPRASPADLPSRPGLRPVGGCSQYPTGSLLRWICEGPGDDPYTNCVRECLKDSFECRGSPNPSRPSMDLVSYLLTDHEKCWSRCQWGPYRARGRLQP
jgi:RHS repeat-associated protein